MDKDDGHSGEGRSEAQTPPWVIFTDLDGTLLESGTYAFESAAGALRRIAERRIPLIFCSSKTRAEQEIYRQQLGLFEPFIVENGAAIFIPDGYFPSGSLPEDEAYRRHGSGYEVIELGMPAATVRARLAVVRRETGLAFRGYREMNLDEVCRETGLDEEAARRTRACEYSERIILGFEPDAWDRFEGALADQGLEGSVSGTSCTVTSAASTKGRAVTYLREPYRVTRGPVTFVGIGDSPNDIPMLQAVDRPYLVQKPDGTWEAIDLPGLRRIEGVASAGWCAAIYDLLGETGGTRPDGDR